MLQKYTYEGWADTITSGWGTTSSGGVISDTLRFVKVASLAIIWKNIHSPIRSNAIIDAVWFIICVMASLLINMWRYLPCLMPPATIQFRTTGKFLLLQWFAQVQTIRKIRNLYIITSMQDAYYWRFGSGWKGRLPGWQWWPPGDQVPLRPGLLLDWCDQLGGRVRRG